MDVYEAVSTRKSVRAFLDKDIAEDVLSRLFEAARLAPSANNRQEWRFVVVRDATTRRRLAQVAHEQVFVGEAPVVIACCAEVDDQVMPCGQLSYPIDVANAIDHLMLCAVAEDLGTCWIGAFDEMLVREILEIPRDMRVVALLPIGYPEDPSPVEKQRLSLNDIVKYERWQ
jgi:nitroreductase